MLSKLLAFKEVAERRSFRAAAESIHISGPALTLRIQALEAELGFKLLIRDKGGVKLTPEGERFLPYARSSIQAFRDGVCEAHKAKSYATSYRVIGSLNFMHSFFPSWLRLLRQERPDMSLLVECGYPDLAVRLFSARLLDLAFSYEQLDLTGLTSSVLFTEKIIMVTSCENIDDWRDHYVFVPWDDTFVQQHLELLDPDLNRPGITFNFIDALRIFALDGPASGYMAQSVAAPYLASGQLKRVPEVPEFERPVYVSHWSRPIDEEAHCNAIDTLKRSLGLKT